MSRFQYKQKSHNRAKTILAICLFLMVIAVFFCGLDFISSTATDQEKESLENALSRSITYCYATEGYYPESLDYIRNKYGLIFDENKFYVDYHAIGANIYPDVTVIELEEK